MVRAGQVVPPKTLSLLPNWTRIAATLQQQQPQPHGGSGAGERTLSVPLSVEVQWTWNSLSDRAGRPVRVGRADLLFRLLPPPPRPPVQESEWADVAVSHVPARSGGAGEGGDGSAAELARLLGESGFSARLVDGSGGATADVRALLRRSRAVVCLLSEGSLGARNPGEVDPKRRAEAAVARAAAEIRAESEAQAAEQPHQHTHRRGVEIGRAHV